MTDTLITATPTKPNAQPRYVTSDPVVLQGEPIIAGTIVAVHIVGKWMRSGFLRF